MGVNEEIDSTVIDVNVDTPQVLELVLEFHQFARKSAEGVLEMARVVRAASLLSTGEFYRFCERTNIKPFSSTSRKLITIGEKFGFLIAQADKLPANWTTIYALAKLADTQIQALIDEGVVNTKTAAAELERALSSRTDNRMARAVGSAASTTAPAHKAKPPSFKVELDATPDAATLQVVRRLIEQLTAMKSKVTLNDSLLALTQNP
jgi:hypothetical protein